MLDLQKNKLKELESYTNAKQKLLKRFSKKADTTAKPVSLGHETLPRLSIHIQTKHPYSD